MFKNVSGRNKMREIKFRAWNPFTQEMVSDFKAAEDSINNTFKIAKIYIMQYTEQKDKNNVEIWHGDIVKGKQFKGNREIIFKDGIYWIKGNHKDYKITGVEII